MFVTGSIFVFPARRNNYINILKSYNASMLPMQLLQRYLERTSGFHEAKCVINMKLSFKMVSAVTLRDVKVSQYRSMSFSVITLQLQNIPLLGWGIIIISITPFIIDIIRQLTVCHSKLAHINSILQPPNLDLQEVINVSQCNIITWLRSSSPSNLIHQSNRS